MGTKNPHDGLNDKPTALAEAFRQAKEEADRDSKVTELHPKALEKVEKSRGRFVEAPVEGF